MTMRERERFDHDDWRELESRPLAEADDTQDVNEDDYGREEDVQEDDELAGDVDR